MNELQEDLDLRLNDYLQLIESPLYEKIEFISSGLSIFLSHN